MALGGATFYDAPRQPWFCDWAFKLQRGKPLREKWVRIPQETEVLITHEPPAGILDEVPGVGNRVTH